MTSWHNCLPVRHPAGLIILGGTACAAVPILVLRYRRKHRPQVLPLGESLNKLPSFSH